MFRTLSQLFEEFIRDQDVNGDRRPRTIQNYRQIFELFQNIAHVDDVNLIRENTVTDFFEKIKKRTRQVAPGKIKKGIKNSTLRSYRFRLDKFFTWLKARKFLKENPLDSMEAPRFESSDVLDFSPKELERIFITIQFIIVWKNNLLKKRNNALFTILLFCGLRRGELLGLRVMDIDLDRRKVHVRPGTSKGRNKRDMVLNQHAYLAMEDYLNERNKLGYRCEMLWVSDRGDVGFTEGGLKKLVERIKKESGVRDFHIHRFRHTFAMQLQKQGCDLNGLMNFMGHSDVRSTLHYLNHQANNPNGKYIERLSFDNFA